VNKPRVLVTGVGSNIGQGIIKALRMAYPHAFVVGVDADRDAAGFFTCDAGHTVPWASEDNYVDTLLEVIGEHSVELVLVGSHPETPIVANARQRLESSGAVVVVGSPEAVARCIDKMKTAEALRAAGCNAPESTIDTSPNGLAAIVKTANFPLIVKPRSGQGSRDLHIVHDRETLSRACQAVETPLVQAYIGDEDGEYTAAVVTDKHGAIASSLVMHRRLHAGTTVLADIVDAPAIEAEARKVVAALGLAGPANVQMRAIDGGAVTFEVNPRLSGTAAMRALAGWNDVGAIVAHYLYNKPIEVGPARPGRVMRYYDEVFVPRHQIESALKNKRTDTDSRNSVTVGLLFDHAKDRGID